MRTTTVALLCHLFASGGAAASDRPPSPPAQPIAATSDAIRIDGALDESVWERAWSMELGFEVHPGENTPAPVRTVVLLTYDREALYVGFRAYYPYPRAIRAHLSDRDSAWGDDWIGIVLDTFNDQRRDYLLLVNPLGVQMDNIELTNADSQDWDGIWESAARITDWGWTAEFKVPFSSLSFQRAAGRAHAVHEHQSHGRRLLRHAPGRRAGGADPAEPDPVLQDRLRLDVLSRPTA